MPDAPNFLIVMTDQQRRDSLPCYGNRFVSAPHTTAFAKSATQFETCSTPYPVCTPARASLWTGLFPHAHGIIDNVYGVDDAFCESPANVPTIFECLSKAGYLTAYFGKWHLGEGRPQWADVWEGFNSLHGHWENGLQDFQGGRYKPEVQTERCIKFLESAANSDRPFVAVQSYYPPHDPYTAPRRHIDPYRGTGLPYPAYYGAVSALDECFGQLLRVLDKSGLASRTVVVFTSDHGETFGSREDSIHKHVCFDEAILVPFLIRIPGGHGGANVRPPIGLQDLTPTMRELAGLAMDPRLHGESLAPLLRDQSDLPRDSNYVQNRTRINGYTQRCVRTSGWKLILSDGGPNSLFDLRNDPEELYDIFDVPREDSHNRYAAFEPTTETKVELAMHMKRRALAIGDDVGSSLANHVIASIS